jgi:hypothetical protein
MSARPSTQNGCVSPREPSVKMEMRGGNAFLQRTARVAAKRWLTIGYDDDLQPQSHYV